jgi:hypothetical protein
MNLMIFGRLRAGSERSSGHTLLAIIELWPVLALCLPSLFGLGLLLFSVQIAEDKILSGRLFEFYWDWFLCVALVTTFIAFLAFVTRGWFGRVDILPALLGSAVLFASALANLYALLGLVLNGVSGFCPDSRAAYLCITSTVIAR